MSHVPIHMCAFVCARTCVSICVPSCVCVSVMPHWEWGEFNGGLKRPSFARRLHKHSNIPVTRSRTVKVKAGLVWMEHMNACGNSVSPLKYGDNCQASHVICQQGSSDTLANNFSVALSTVLPHSCFYSLNSKIYLNSPIHIGQIIFFFLLRRVPNSEMTHNRVKWPINIKVAAVITSGQFCKCYRKVLYYILWHKVCTHNCIWPWLNAGKVWSGPGVKCQNFTKFGWL